MCRNIGSSSQLGNVITDLPTLVISPRIDTGLDFISKNIGALDITEQPENHCYAVDSRNASAGDGLWQYGSTDSESDLFIRSETGSESSCTDDLDSDAALRLRTEFESFEAALYNDTPYSSIAEPLLKESRLLALCIPHIRINGTKCKVYDPIGDSIQNQDCIGQEECEEQEEVFASHGESCDMLSVDNEDYEDPGLADENCPQLEEAEGVNLETCEQLFQDIWPSITQSVKSFAEKLVKLKSSTVQRDCIELSQSQLRCAMEYEKKMLGAARLSVSPLPFRSKSSRDQYNSNELPLADENIPFRTFSKSSNVCDRKRQIAKLGNAVIIPPTISVSSACKGDQKRNRTHAVSAKMSKTTNQFDYRSKFHMKQVVTPQNKIRHGLLPPIENLDVAPKIDHTRANSAMIRCRTSSSQPQRFTARNRALLAPIELKKPIQSHSRYKESLRKEELTSEHYDHTQMPGELKQGRQIKPIPWK